MVRVLAVVDVLTCGLVEELAPDLILGAGDLPFDYLETLSTRSGAPCVVVPGNHDRDLEGFHRSRSGWVRAGLPAADPGPRGAVNADGRVVTVAGLRIAGLGGSIRYNDGPNQYHESTQRHRASGDFGSAKRSASSSLGARSRAAGSARSSSRWFAWRAEPRCFPPSPTTRHPTCGWRASYRLVRTHVRDGNIIDALRTLAPRRRP